MSLAVLPLVALLALASNATPQGRYGDESQPGPVNNFLIDMDHVEQADNAIARLRGTSIEMRLNKKLAGEHQRAEEMRRTKEQLELELAEMLEKKKNKIANFNEQISMKGAEIANIKKQIDAAVRKNATMFAGGRVELVERQEYSDRETIKGLIEKARKSYEQRVEEQNEQSVKKTDELINKRNEEKKRLEQSVKQRDEANESDRVDEEKRYTTKMDEQTELNKRLVKQENELHVKVLAEEKERHRRALADLEKANAQKAEELRSEKIATKKDREQRHREQVQAAKDEYGAQLERLNREYDPQILEHKEEVTKAEEQLNVAENLEKELVEIYALLQKVESQKVSKEEQMQKCEGSETCKINNFKAGDVRDAVVKYQRKVQLISLADRMYQLNQCLKDMQFDAQYGYLVRARCNIYEIQKIGVAVSEEKGQVLEPAECRRCYIEGCNTQYLKIKLDASKMGIQLSPDSAHSSVASAISGAWGNLVSIVTNSINEETVRKAFQDLSVYRDKVFEEVGRKVMGASAQQQGAAEQPSAAEQQ